MSSFAELGDDLLAVASEPRRSGNKFFPKKPRRVFAPSLDVKYAKSTTFKWKVKNKKGTLIDEDALKLRGIVVDQSFTWTDRTWDADNRKWIWNCGVVAHRLPTDAEGESVTGSGHWKLPFFDDQEILKRYAPEGMKTVKNEDGSTRQMTCAECIASGLKTCKPEGGIHFVNFQSMDKKTEEWVDLKELALMNIAISRGSYDGYRRYLGKVKQQHGLNPDQVITEFSISEKTNANGTHWLNAMEDIDEAGWVNQAQEVFGQEKAKWVAMIEDFKKAKAAEREAEGGSGTGGSGAKPTTTAPAAKTKVTDIATKKAVSPAPVADPADFDDADLPF